MADPSKMKLDRLSYEGQSAVMDKCNNGATQKEIQKFVKDEFGLYVSDRSIGKWLKRRRAAAHKAIYGSETYTNQVCKAYSELINNYCDAAEIVFKRLEDINKTGKPTREMKDMIEALTLCLNTLKEHLGEGNHKEFASMDSVLKKVRKRAEDLGVIEVKEL